MSSGSTSRSPYPTVHLLREVDVTRATDAHPDTLAIPETNVARLRGVGREALYNQLAELKATRAGAGGGAAAGESSGVVPATVVPIGNSRTRRTERRAEEREARDGAGGEASS
jgi:hypothetical protein